MKASQSLAADVVLRGYVHAKDENRPFLLRDVFTSEAELLINNSSANISFPAATRGREEIAEALVSSFGAVYENVYSFYMSRPPPSTRQFTCDWLVGMSGKSTRQVRVGCGSYRWEFQPQAPGLARRLSITIAAMQVLPAGEFERVFAWLGALTYPWSTPASSVRGMPPVALLAPISEYLSRRGGTA